MRTAWQPASDNAHRFGVRGTPTYLGIDFSGGAAPWQARCSRPTVWIASIEDEASPRLADLRPVQDLPGTEEPFARLATRLRQVDYTAACIDAPFSIPAEHLPPGGHRALLTRVAALPGADDRPLPSGKALVAMAKEVAPLRLKKPMRDTEEVWSKRGLTRVPRCGTARVAVHRSPPPASRC